MFRKFALPIALVLIDLAAFYAALSGAIVFRAYALPIGQGLTTPSAIAQLAVAVPGHSATSAPAAPAAKTSAKSVTKTRKVLSGEQMARQAVAKAERSLRYQRAFYWRHLGLWWLPAAFIAMLAYEGLYVKRLVFWQESRLLLRSSFMAFGVVLAVVSLGRLSEDVSRLLLLLTWMVSMPTLLVFRWIGKRTLFGFRIFKENVLILGAGQAGQATLTGLERERNLGYRVIGFLDDHVNDEERIVRTPLGEYKVFGAVRHYHRFIRAMRVSCIVIAMPDDGNGEVTRIVSEVQRHVRNVMLVPQYRGVALLNTELQTLFMEQLFLLNIRNNLKSLSARIVKRTFDVTVSTLGLVVLSAVFGVLWLAVRLTSAGPVLFTQTRPGKFGKTIYMYKFRTMYVDGDDRLAGYLAKDPQLAEEWRVYRKLKSYDPRVTNVGRFLRKWSLDELPQVWNVIKGEMSMVGPRPYMMSEIDRFSDVSEIVFMAKPGICGLWQAVGRNRLTFDERVKLDTWYVLNWSLWLDILLMFKTALAVVRRDGAY